MRWIKEASKVRSKNNHMAKKKSNAGRPALIDKVRVVVFVSGQQNADELTKIAKSMQVYEPKKSTK